MLGGPILASGVTNANFYAMIEIFLIFDQGYFLQRRHSTGNYYITKGRIFTYSTASAEFKQASSASTMSPGWFVRSQLQVLPELQSFVMLFARGIGGVVTGEVLKLHTFFHPSIYGYHWWSQIPGIS